MLFRAGNGGLKILSGRCKSAGSTRTRLHAPGLWTFLSDFSPSSAVWLLCFSRPQIHETIETINQLKTQREFMLSFARDPQGFINDWLQSQCRDLKVKTLACVEGGSSHAEGETTSRSERQEVT